MKSLALIAVAVACPLAALAGHDSFNHLKHRHADIAARHAQPLQKRCERKSGPRSSSIAAASTSSTSSAASTASSSSPGKGAPEPAKASGGGHTFSFQNNCQNAVQPVFADTSCGYSPRCSDAGHFTGAQPSSIEPNGSGSAVAPKNWVGRVFAKAPQCGPKGEDCTMLEFNLDSDSQYTPNAYDISNIQGFTQSVSVQCDGVAAVACTSANCSPKSAYAKGDMAGNAAGGPIDQAVRACGAGNVGFKVVFCP